MWCVFSHLLLYSCLVVWGTYSPGHGVDFSSTHQSPPQMVILYYFSLTLLQTLQAVHLKHYQVETPENTYHHKLSGRQIGIVAISYTSQTPENTYHHKLLGRQIGIVVISYTSHTPENTYHHKLSGRRIGIVAISNNSHLYDSGLSPGFSKWAKIC